MVFYNISLPEFNKKDGKEYEPSSLAAIQSSNDRYLRESIYDMY